MKNIFSHNNSKLLAAVLACILTAALLVPLFASAAATVTGKPTASVRLRKYPSTNNSKVLQTLGTSDTVNVISKGKGADGKTWYYVKYGSLKGYISGSYLKVSNAGSLKTETYSWPGKSTSSKSSSTSTSKTTTSSSASGKSSTSNTSSIKTEKLDWFSKGKSIFGKNGLRFQMKDVKSGTIVNCRSRKGTNHMDAEPVSAADTQKLLSIYGGKFDWKRHPVLVKYNGHVYAGSMYCEPHGDSAINDNNFSGHFCIHFSGSKTHGSGNVDSGHQNAISQALKATW